MRALATGLIGCIAKTARHLSPTAPSALEEGPSYATIAAGR
jgi:hypothetical protein